MSITCCKQQFVNDIETFPCVEQRVDVNLSYLQYKWRTLFVFLDVNKDNVLDKADMELERTNFVHLNNLTEREV